MKQPVLARAPDRPISCSVRAVRTPVRDEVHRTMATLISTLIFGLVLALSGSALGSPRAYIPNSGQANDGTTISVIDAVSNTVIGSPITVGTAPAGVAAHPNGTRVYVTNFANGQNSVSVIDTGTNSVSATIPVGPSPYGVAIDPAGARVYVANSNDNTVSVINTVTNTVVATIDL